MARRWKGIVPTYSPKDVIEHSINKYKESTPTHYPTIVHQARESLITNAFTISTRIRWTKEACEKYIEELRKKGYIEGAALHTKWDINGTLEKFIPIPEDGIEFFHQKYPNIFSIKRSYGTSNCLYNEEEAKPIEGVTT